jgi:hypothetical protein
MSFQISCSLCRILLEPNTQCKHGKFIQKEAEKQEIRKVIINKSIFGDKTKEEIMTIKVRLNKLICRCGQSYDDRGSGYRINHTCTLYGVENTMTGYFGICVDSLKHPSELSYMCDCEGCQGTGQIRVRQFKRCHACEGTGGTKCIGCAGLGAESRYSEYSFGPCSKKCYSGYKEMCALCNGECAIRGGTILTKCNRCVQPEVPCIKPIVQVGDRIVQVRQLLTLPQITNPSPRPLSPSQLTSPRPPSPSQISLSQVKLEPINRTQ